MGEKIKEEKRNAITLYVNGHPGKESVSIVMEKHFAKAHAEALLEAIDSLDENTRDIGFELEGVLVASNKVMTSDINYSEEVEDAGESTPAD